MSIKQTNEFDAIVVGAGMSGGWAAKELTEKGLKTLVLDRGRSVEHVKDYPTTHSAPWDFQFRKELSAEDKKDYHVQSKNYAFNESTKHNFIKDTEHPYTTPDDKPFNWFRGYQTGGKSLLWYRQSYRLSQMDFEANAKDGHGVDWPVRYDEMEPWYDYVQNFIGISGMAEGLDHLPDGNLLPPMDLSCVEQHLRESIKKKWPDRTLTIGRTTNLTKMHNGRGPCQYRNLCERGCPYGAYFSSVSVTLPPAMATGNLTLRPHSIVHSIIYDEKQDKATGVRVIDTETNETFEYFAKVIFLCAGTLPSTQIMLHSKTDRFSEGLANSSGMLGHHIMDHFGFRIYADVPGFEDGYFNGHRPNGIYVPRFRNITEKHPDFVRGYGFQGGAHRLGWDRGTDMTGIGADFKSEISKPGPWKMRFSTFGECLPDYDNKVELHPELKDKWGLPILHISCELKENENAMMQDMTETGVEMLENAGFNNIEVQSPDTYTFGDGIHEMGTARMGKDPKTSVLNKWNQCHDVKNLYITDGSFMASSACQNPSLTYMAFTARAANHAAEALKKGEL